MNIDLQLIFLIAGTVCVTILFVNSEPTIQLKRLLGFKEENFNDYSKLKQTIYKLITCCMCSGFHFGWISALVWFLLPTSHFVLSIVFFASIVSVISELLDSKL